MNTVFDQMLSRYEIQTIEDKQNALHEIMQEISLAALYRSGFFDKAAFYGGTCLRIFHQLPRFSEDLDFSLMEKDETFSLDQYMDAIKDEFRFYGREVEIIKKTKSVKTNIESAFLKDNTEIYDIAFQTEKAIKIKVEVDKNPPLLFETEQNLLLLPYSFMVRCFSIPNLFAGKMHAFLFRAWNNRVKGRDWYDIEWYVRHNYPLHFEHLKERCVQSGHVRREDFNREFLMGLLHKKVSESSIERVKEDVLPFIKNTKELSIWSTEYFLKLITKIRII
jgi:predicted nucleotidyltransferase component of viral defense system